MYAKKVIFTGKVQAVGFRNDTCRIMDNFSLTGYVKNIEPTGPYSGNQVELFIQSSDENELKKAINIIKLYFGPKHIHKTTVKNVAPDLKIKTFEEQRKDWSEWYKAHPVAMSKTGTGYNSGFKSGRLFDDYPDYKECIICGFQTSFKCDCGKIHLCKLCKTKSEVNKEAKEKMDSLHICTKPAIPEKRPATPIHKSNPELVQIDGTGKRFAKSCPENSCSECNRIYTTMRTDCCNQPLCKTCAATGLHICKKSIKPEKEGVIKKIMKSVF